MHDDVIDNKFNFLKVLYTDTHDELNKRGVLGNRSISSLNASACIALLMLFFLLSFVNLYFLNIRQPHDLDHKTKQSWVYVQISMCK